MAKAVIFYQLMTGSYRNFTYVIGDEKTGQATVVDPHAELEKVMKLLSNHALKLIYVINTHSHWDHVAGNNQFVAQTGAKVIMHSRSKLKKDIDVNDSDNVRIGDITVRVLHTPGHCPDEICLIVDNKILTGDTLFVGECGRTDIPGGNAEEMWNSLFNKIMKLDDSMEVYPGHDYGPKPSSTIGRERKTNYTLKPRTLDEFVKFMVAP